MMKSAVYYPDIDRKMKKSLHFSAMTYVCIDFFHAFWYNKYMGNGTDYANR